MPNHVECHLKVSGDPTILREFVEFARGPGGTSVDDKQKDEPLSAHKFIPVPDEFWHNEYLCQDCGHKLRNPADLFPKCPECGGRMQDAYNRGGYEWCVQHWGTKWGLYDIQVTDAEPDAGYLTYCFQTAWSPPEPVVRAMAKRFLALTFDLSYYEGGMGFQGHLELEGGETVAEWTGEYRGERGG